jgi:SAM-dependent methyltransferase
MRGQEVSNPYIAPHLAELPLHRVLIRSSECLLLSETHFERPLLDIGSGDGHFATTLFAEPVDVGIDPDPQTMQEAARRGGHRNLIVASATALPMRDASFASVLSNSTLEHIPDVDAAVAEAARVLRPGGLLAATFPSEHFGEYLLFASLPRGLGLRGLGRAYGRWFNRISYHYHVDGPDTWRQRFEAAGLDVLRWRYYFPARNHWLFDLSHYLSAPALVTRRLLGRWVLFPQKARLGLLNWALTPFCSHGPEDRGAYLFFLCRRPPAQGRSQEGSAHVH